MEVLKIPKWTHRLQMSFEPAWWAARMACWTWLYITGRSPLRVGFDLDGVLDEFFYGREETWLRLHLGSINEAARSFVGDGSSLVTPNIEVTLGISQELAGDLFGKFIASDLGFALVVSRHARWRLRRIWLFNRLFVITARDSYWEDATIQWLRYVYLSMLPRKAVFWANYIYDDREKITKRQLCDQLGIHVLVDDSPSYLGEYAGDPRSRVFCALYGGFQWTKAGEADFSNRPRTFRALSLRQVLAREQARMIRRTLRKDHSTR